MTMILRDWCHDPPRQRVRTEDPLPPDRPGSGDAETRGRDHQTGKADRAPRSARRGERRRRAGSLARNPAPRRRPLRFRDRGNVAGSPALSLLLDTHAWVWSVTRPEKLSQRQRTAINRSRRSSREPLLVSIISCWEVALLAQRGR